ncbi:BlaI/MecI/CopY family transcriptional regulator [Leadbetterella sp. DM7]|uniref:BlaI/MecI/CopY family transcriptional regulator n=1 Tax=Leadbetterella sp. DM7 TaxID=3235085 RepID=UPI00349EC509
MKQLPKPTESELEILQILWKKGASTVRQVNEELSRHKEVGYTTTLKLMQIMHEKNLVTRTEEGRYHIYQAAIEEESTQKLLLDRFIDTAFRGSASRMVMQALGNESVSKDELDEIKAWIETLENKK